MMEFGGICMLLSLLSACHAALYNRNEIIGLGCARAAQDLFTTCNQEDYDCFCNSNLYVYAVQKCIARETNYVNLKTALAFDMFDRRFCVSHNTHANITDVLSAENLRLDPTVSEKAFELSFQGERNNYTQKKISVYLGVGLVLYWVAIIMVIALARVFNRVCLRLFGSRAVMRRGSAIERWCHRRILWPALFSSRHMLSFQFFRGWMTFSLPTRFESLLVSGYIILAVIFMLTPYTIMNNDPLFSSRWKEHLRYSSDRAGILATIQFPLLTCFALRNNIFIWMCGWSYSSFNTCHRAVARVTYILLVVHAILKHVFSASYGSSLAKYYYPVPYFRWGCAAIGLFSLMIMFAIIRNRSYEVFYRLHQLMALGGFVCSIFHLRGLGFKEPLWISIALWGADWIVRLVRIYTFNINIFFTPLPGSQHLTYATARLFENETIRLTLRTPVRWFFSPGQYIFLHTSRWSLIGGHPFSVLGSSETNDGLEILMKARGGMTRKLYSSLSDRNCTPIYPITLPVYVEGPYGESVPVENYDEGLFFAGGIGITGVLGYVEKMAQSTHKLSTPKQVRLFWSIRSKKDLSPVIERIARLSRMNGVHITIYQRRAPMRMSVMSETKNGEITDSALQNPYEVNYLENVSLESDEEHEGETVASSPMKALSSRGHTLGNPVSPSGRYSMQMLPPNPSATSTQRPPSTQANKHLSPKPFPRRSDGWFDDTPMVRPVSRRGSHHPRLSDARSSVVNFVNSRSPEDDDDFEYGRKYSAELVALPPSPSARHWSTSSSRYSGTMVSDKASDVPHKHTRSYELKEAGFTDSFAERRMSLAPDFDGGILSERYATTEVESLAGKETSDDVSRVYHQIISSGMDVSALVMNRFKLSEGSVCVVGCGPDRMMDTLCWSCCEFLEIAKNGRVDYYEEAFKW